MSAYFDGLETRSADQRMAEQVADLRARLAAIDAPEAWRAAAAEVQGVEDLVKLPVLRKSDLSAWQKAWASIFRC